MMSLSSFRPLCRTVVGRVGLCKLAHLHNLNPHPTEWKMHSKHSQGPSGSYHLFTSLPHKRLAKGPHTCLSRTTPYSVNSVLAYLFSFYCPRDGWQRYATFVLSRAKHCDLLSWESDWKLSWHWFSWVQGGHGDFFDILVGDTGGKNQFGDFKSREQRFCRNHREWPSGATSQLIKPAENYVRVSQRIIEVYLADAIKSC